MNNKTKTIVCIIMMCALPVSAILAQAKADSLSVTMQKTDSIATVKSDSMVAVEKTDTTTAKASTTTAKVNKPIKQSIRQQREAVQDTSIALSYVLDSLTAVEKSLTTLLTKASIKTTAVLERYPVPHSHCARTKWFNVPKKRLRNELCASDLISEKIAASQDRIKMLEELKKKIPAPVDTNTTCAADCVNDSLTLANNASPLRKVGASAKSKKPGNGRDGESQKLIGKLEEFVIED